MAMRNRFGLEPIYTIDDLESRVRQIGILPMFNIGVHGLSVHDITPHFWRDEDGPWEWKGPMIRNGECAYGKLCLRKAAWVSGELLPHFVNYRTSLHLAKNEDVRALDEIVLQAIEAEGVVTGRELASMLGLGGRKKKRTATDIPDDMHAPIKISIDSILSRLMMEGRVLISDFVYNIDKSGARYGWGIAKYATPSFIYGDIRVDCDPQDSYEVLYSALQERFPVGSEAVIRMLIG